ncbi:class C sortase [Corynebacterium gallinarum]|nr:class C sortase [Corynebacterium gallinarum]
MKQNADMVGSSDPGGILKTPPHMKRVGTSKRNLVIPWILQLGAMIGIAVLLYPSAADWFATRAHNAEVSGYLQEVEKAPATELVEQRRLAAQYNADIPEGILQDPFTRPVTGNQQNSTGAHQNYAEMLQVGDREAIGEFLYPDVGISLPIYQGTDDAVLKKGVGHVHGSSLPVGGESTRAVLTSHSGLVNASLFTELFDAEVGHIFSVSVLGERLHYEVKSLETVLPQQTESLKVIDGEDWITLITCTPIGVNSHRLLVHAQRVSAPSTDVNDVIAGDGQKAGIPWWALIFCASSSIVAYVIFAQRPEKNQGGRHRVNKQILKVKQ